MWLVRSDNNGEIYQCLASLVSRVLNGLVELLVKQAIIFVMLFGGLLSRTLDVGTG